MQRRSPAVSSAVVIVTVALLAGCTFGTNLAGGGSEAASDPLESSESAASTAGEDAALTQAQAWFDAANLPPGAVPTQTPSVSFTSYTGWPCGPYEELEGYWMISNTTVVDAANWLIENPTADLITTNFALTHEEWRAVDSATVGYIPAPEAQEGIVYTIAKMDDGVAIRAEVAAQTDAATCPPLPDGGTYGAPGQG